jgi:hypothetical protein
MLTFDKWGKALQNEGDIINQPFYGQGWRIEELPPPHKTNQ